MLLSSKAAEKRKVDKLYLLLSVMAVILIAIIGMFLLKAEDVSKSYIEPVENISSENISEDATSNMVNINTASKEELMLLNGIGEAKAESIIAYRKANPFKTTKEITNVKGIGDSIYELISDYICVE